MLELRNFCLQYKEWKRILGTIDGYKEDCSHETPINPDYFGLSSVEKLIFRRNEFVHKVWLVEQAAKLADESLATYVIKGVTDGFSYDILMARYEIPCSRGKYYDTYRKFFYILDKMRG